MAVGTPYKIAADTGATTSSTDASVTTNALAHSGDTLFVWCATRLTNKAIISSISGPTGGTVEIVSLVNPSVTAAISIARQHLTADYASASALTVTLNLASTRKATGAFAVPGLADQVVDVSSTNSGTTGNPDTGTSGASSLADAIAIGVFQHNASAGTDTGTPGTGYTELSDFIVGASSWCQGYVEYQILTATGTQDATFTPTATTTNWTALLGVWDGVSGGGGAVTPRQLAALGVGT